MINIKLLSFSALAISLFALRSGADQTSARARFLREAPAAWGRLSRAERQSAGSIHQQSYAYTAGVKNSTWGKNKHIEFQRNENLYTLLEWHEASDRKVSVSAVAPTYAFRADRSSNSSLYALRGIMFGPPERTQPVIMEKTYFFLATQANRALWGVPIADLVAEPHFILKKVVETGDGPEQLVRVDFECKPKKYKINFMNASMILDPSRDWSLVEAEYDVREGWRTTIKNEFKDRGPGQPSLSRHLHVNAFNDTQSQESYEFHFEDHQTKVIPQSAFLLSAYGLPEPNRPMGADRRDRSPYLFFGGAAVLFAVALGIRWKARRRA